ncbi:MAG: hypothetical protein HQ521_10985 [Bacteroidetes bacterium]|nr:hypothetical protein [Bacteroidota bacterium]
MAKINFNNVILISGSGRNCGKTTVACHIISQLAKTDQVTGLKISPHFHITENKQVLVYEDHRFSIYRELDTRSGKDSSRMLVAGASSVYFVRCTDNDLPFIYNVLRKLIPDNSPIVCESGSFASSYKPGYHILVVGENADETKESYISNLDKANKIILQEDFSQESINFQVNYNSGDWQIKKVMQNTLNMN